MDTFLIIFLGSVLITAAVSDLRFQKIPNLLTFPAMIMGLACHGATSGLDGLLFSAKGLTVGIVVLILPYLMGGMGAGDAKLMGAVGAILGPKGVFIAFLFTAIVGGVYALMLLLIERKYGKEFVTEWGTSIKTFIFTRQFVPVPAGKNENKPKLCYGIAIALGTLFYLFLELSGYKFPI